MGFLSPRYPMLFGKRPLLLLANQKDTLLPRLKFFSVYRCFQCCLARTLTVDPTLLTRRLEKQIIPSYTFLKSVLLLDEKVVASLKRTSWNFLEHHSKNFIPNLAVLREAGVPESCVTLLLTHFPEALIRKKDQFSEIVVKVKEMGYDPMKSTFALAIRTISGECNRATRNRCYEVYQRWGLSKDDNFPAFRKHPHCIILSENKIIEAMDFWVNKKCLPSGMIARCPVVLFFSLEKRIKPRCSIVKILSLKGLIRKTLSLTTVLLPEEKLFLEKFVINYEEDVPQLLSMYHGKLDIKSAI